MRSLWMLQLGAAVAAEAQSLCRTSTTISVPPATRILQAASTCTSPSGAFTNPGPYTTIYQTTFLEFCPTGLQPKTYTITETCPGGLPTPKPTDHVPPGFTTTISECHVCGETPITATLTIPCGKCQGHPEGPGTYPAATGAPNTDNGNGHANGGPVPDNGNGHSNGAPNTDNGSGHANGAPNTDNGSGHGNGTPNTDNGSGHANGAPNTDNGHGQAEQGNPKGAPPSNPDNGHGTPAGHECTDGKCSGKPDGHPGVGSGPSATQAAQPGHTAVGSAAGQGAGSGGQANGDMMHSAQSGAPSGTECKGKDCQAGTATASGHATYTGSAPITRHVGGFTALLLVLISLLPGTPYL